MLPTSASNKPLHERFSSHNYYVGLLLAAWGLLITATGQPESVAKSLAQHDTLNSLMNIAQIVTIGAGAALVVSGMGVAQKEIWGYYLAAGCGVCFIVCGLIFFAAFRYLGTFPGLENSVARMYFVRSNFDLIISFVDGGGLLVFLYYHYQRNQAAEPEA